MGASQLWGCDDVVVVFFCVEWGDGGESALGLGVKLLSSSSSFGGRGGKSASGGREGEGNC